jgi:hypothetical protein
MILLIPVISNAASLSVRYYAPTAAAIAFVPVALQSRPMTKFSLFVYLTGFIFVGGTLLIY